MKATSFAYLILLVVVFVRAQDDDLDEEESEEYRQCNKERRRGLVSIKKSMELCDNEKTIEGSRCDPAVRNCIAKCVMKDQDVLDENGMITAEAVENAIDNRATPGRYRDGFLKTVKDCIAEHKDKVKPDDPACSGYEAVGHCLEEGINKICEDPEPDAATDAGGAKDEL